MTSNLYSLSVRLVLGTAPFLFLAGCGGQEGTAEEIVPLASELSLEAGEDESPASSTSAALMPKGPPSLFRLAREGIQRFNGDVHAVFDRIHDIAMNQEPTISEPGRRVWLRKDGDSMLRLVIERKKLGEIGYAPEDEMPGDDAVGDGQAPQDKNLVAWRFAREMKKVSEEDGAFRLCAHGHVVRVQGEPLGTGAVVVHRARIAEVKPELVGSREQLAVRFDHRGKARRTVIRHRAQDTDGNSVRSAWIYRQFDGKAGVLKMVRFGDLPYTPVSGGKNELVTLLSQWLRTPKGLVARAHAEITHGDLGPDKVQIIECLDGIDHLGFRLVLLNDGTIHKLASMGDPAACHPFNRDILPPAPEGEKLPPDAAPAI